MEGKFTELLGVGYRQGIEERKKLPTQRLHGLLEFRESRAHFDISS
jgi:hypothetical protein